MSDRLTILRWLYVRCYRALMKLAHRHGWHHAPASRWLGNDAGWPLCRCDWCGMSGFVMPKLTAADLAGPIGGERRLENAIPAMREDNVPSQAVTDRPYPFGNGPFI